MNCFKPSIIIFLSLFFLCFQTVSAKDIEIKCTEKECKPANLADLFEGTQIWYPSLTLSNKVTLLNQSPQANVFSVRGKNISDPSRVAAVLRLRIIRQDGKLLWSGSLAEFLRQGELELGKFTSKTQISYLFEVSLSAKAGNEYQGKQTKINFTFNFLPVDTQDFSAILGAQTETPCLDPKPTKPSAISLLVNNQSHWVTVSWPYPENYTSFAVGYSDTPDKIKWQDTDIGSTNKYTIAGLSEGDFYFWVKTKNGCQESDFSLPSKVTFTKELATPSLLTQSSNSFIAQILKLLLATFRELENLFS